MIAILILGLLSQGIVDGITDLGVMTDYRIINLQTREPDLKLSFIIELNALRFPSNSVTFTKTNSWLSMQDFVAMPPGPVIIGARAVSGGMISPTNSLAKVFIQRDPPQPPEFKMADVPAPPPSTMLSNQMQQIRKERSTVVPPSPVLPGSSKTYSEHMIEMHRFWIEHQGRRNQ